MTRLQRPSPSSGGGKSSKRNRKGTNNNNNNNNNNDSSCGRNILSAMTVSATSGRTTKCVQGLLILSLGLVLGHTLTLLQQGNTLVQQQIDEFANQHKNNFLGQHQGGQEDIKKYGAQWIPSKNNNNEPLQPPATMTIDPNQPLASLKILVAIASYDFSQLPHLEETLDGYHDVCMAGVTKLDIYVHTTVVYPVAWLDMWQTRFNCPQLTLTMVIQNKNVRLHLVDLHRQLFYDEINNYDLFIYTEDDIRVKPTTVATYWQETQILKQRMQSTTATKIDYTLFNVGIVRYEYNFPSVIIDDKTRHATEHVTRVYWEHSIPLAQNKPIVPHAAQGLDQLNNNNNNSHAATTTHYIHMKNHHQGMFLATRDHLLKWKQLPTCKFDIATKRPGYGKNQRQPILGTQRVWMSSYQLYEPKYCNIQQVLPVEKFGALTVHHVPNKNYRRKKGGKTLLDFGNKTYQGLDQGSPDLITALQLHLVLAKEYPKQASSQSKYRGKIRIIDKVNHERTPLLEQRLRAWNKYVQRGGIMSEEDMTNTNLIEWSERLEYIIKIANRKRRAEERKRQQQQQQQGEIEEEEEEGP